MRATEDLIEKLQAQPSVLAQKRLVTFSLKQQVRVAERELKRAEAKLWISGQIEGKNAEIRAAQLFEWTMDEVLRVDLAKRQYEDAARELDDAQDDFRCLLAIADVWRVR